jgi:hypothetical protein
MNEYESRALSAYFRSSGQTASQPQAPETLEHEGRQYVVLSNVNGILAVYRIKPDGFLKGLKRWPKEIDNHFR